MKILFVDNHPELTATVIASFLRDHDVIVVPTIAAAKHSIESSTFDVVLVDYDLDDGKGDELVRWLRLRDPAAKIVAVSAHETGNAALVGAGACTVCAKTSFATIAAVLQDLIGDLRDHEPAMTPED
ncbi:MAG TPA: response regulator [Kofleriaceae bacterium]|nr:response regulator [Kofleriaceae bacterium]